MNISNRKDEIKATIDELKIMEKEYELYLKLALYISGQVRDICHEIERTDSALIRDVYHYDEAIVNSGETRNDLYEYANEIINQTIEAFRKG